MTSPAAAFDAPRRLHPLTLLFAAIPVARTFSYLAALVGAILVDSGLAIGDIVKWVTLILGVPALVVAAAKYASFRFRLGTDELVFESGLLHRQHRVVPLSRVQNIDIRQNPLQRILGVAQLRVETASGSAEAEVDFSVLGRKLAEALRLEILASRSSQETTEDADASHPGAEPAPHTIPLVRLSAVDLAIAGATANEASLIVAALAGMWRLLDDVLFRQWEPVAWLVDQSLREPTFGPVVVVSAVVAILVLLGWGFSVVGAVVRYHDFTLERRGDELHKRYGLLSRREGNIRLGRVQALRIEESILRRPLTLAAIKIETAGATPKQRQEEALEGAEAIVPLLRTPRIASLVANIFADLDYGTIDLHPVHPRSQRRAFTRYAVTLAALTLALGVWAPGAAVGVPLLVPLAWVLARAQYRHRGYALAPGYIIARAGVLNRTTWIIPRHKLQTLHLTETLFQRRLGLASVVIDTAAGGQQAVVHDLGRQDAERLMSSIVWPPDGTVLGARRGS